MLKARTIDRTKPPETPHIPSYKMPAAREARLASGLSLVLLEDARFPLVTARLSFPAGSKFDPKDLPGLAGMVAGLLTQGTTSRSFRDLAEELALIGATLRGTYSPDVLTLAGSVLAENTGKFLDLVADIAVYANFPSEEVELRKQNRKQELYLQRSQAAFLANEKLDAILFGDHPYAHIAPTMESLDRMDSKVMAEFQASYLAPNHAVLILLGQLPPKVEDQVRERFGSWNGRAAPATPAAKFPPSKRALVLVDRPGSVEADIHIGRLAVTRTDPDYFPLLVGNTILGGGPSSRLFHDVREQKGFAYDVHSELDRRKDAGAALAITQVANDVVEPALEAVLANLAQMGRSAVSTSELSDAKNYMSGTFLMSLETQGGLADQLDLVNTMGLPRDYLETFTAKVRAVEPDQIQAAAAKYLSPEEAAIVVVGDASQIQKPLEKFGCVQVEPAK